MSKRLGPVRRGRTALGAVFRLRVLERRGLVSRHVSCDWPFWNVVVALLHPEALFSQKQVS